MPHNMRKKQIEDQYQGRLFQLQVRNITVEVNIKGTFDKKNEDHSLNYLIREKTEIPVGRSKALLSEMQEENFDLEKAIIELKDYQAALIMTVDVLKEDLQTIQEALAVIFSV